MLKSTSGSAILYHFTSIQKAIKIVADGFVLTPTAMTQSDAAISEPASHFLSFTRMADGRYHRNDVEGVLFKFDGNKLSTRYKIRPVDYWQMYQTPKLRYDSDEAEERLFSNSPKLDLMRYVTEVRVLIPKAGLTVSQLRKFVSLRKTGRAVLFFKTHKEFVQGRAKDAIVLRDIPKMEKQRAWPGRPRYTDDLMSAMLTVLNLLAKNPDMNLYTDLKNIDIDRRYKNYIVSYRSDFANVLSAEFHNAGRAQSTNPKLRQRLDSLIRIMRRFGLHKPKDLADFIIDKYDSGRPKEKSNHAW